MSEFEVHQLIVGSRYEFDLATLIYLLWALAFIFLCRTDSKPWKLPGALLVGGFYLTGAAFIALRCVAAIIRSIKQTALLDQTAHQFDFANPAVQLPTLVLRLVLAVVAPIVVIYFVSAKASPKQD